jgi:hypothetical protein
VSADAQAANTGVNANGCVQRDIQDAINLALPGTVVFVEASAVPIVESFVINKELTIRASEPGSNCLSLVTTPGLRAIFRAEPDEPVISINLFGDVKLFDVTVESADLRTGGFQFGEFGGGIDIINADVSLTRVDVRNNDGFVGGGIGIQGGSLTLNDSEVYGNRALSGGGIGAVNSEVTLLGTTRVGQTTNRAEVFGGGIHLVDSDLVVSGEAVVRRGRPIGGSLLKGGAISAWTLGGGGSSVVIRDNALVGDSDADQGGVIWVDRGLIDISDSAELREGEADGDGGLIYAIDSDVVVAGSALLTIGHAEGVGGLIYADGSNVSISGDLINSPGVVLSEGSAQDGAGIYAVESVVDVLGVSSVVNNVATGLGGGVYLDRSSYSQGSNTTVGTEAEPNRAMHGGGIYATESDLDIRSTSAWALDEDPDALPEGGARIEGNIASRSGGGIELHSSDLYGQRVVIARNRASAEVGFGEGGGIAVYPGATATFYDSSFYWNRAREQGGGAYVSGGTLDVLSFLNQPVEGFCLASEEFHRYCSEFYKNEAGLPDILGIGSGGAIFADNASSVNITRTAVLRNGAHDQAHQLLARESTDMSLQDTLVADAEVALFGAAEGLLVEDNATFDARASTFAGEGTTLDITSVAGSYLGASIIWPDGTPGAGLLLTGNLPGACNVGLGVLQASGPLNSSSDPLFMDTIRGPYRIASNSPAFNRCQHVSTVDLDDTSRPQCGIKDAGAFEALICP